MTDKKYKLTDDAMRRFVAFCDDAGASTIQGFTASKELRMIETSRNHGMIGETATCKFGGIGVGHEQSPVDQDATFQFTAEDWVTDES